MTSAHSMLNRMTTAVLLTALVVLFGCKTTDPRDRLVAPSTIVAPYAAMGGGPSGDLTWAVLPPRNESGTSIVRTDLVGDELVAAVQQIHGVRCIPLNRSIAAARELGLTDGPETSGDAVRLAESLGVDAVLVASITAYDPYDPPTIGLALALYARPGAMTAETSDTGIDPVAMSMAFTDFGRFDSARFGGEPVTVIGQHFDGRDHAIQMAVKQYAEGRSDPTSAMRWRIYLASMELYTRFATHHTVGRLIDEEWLRLARQRTAQRRVP